MTEALGKIAFWIAKPSNLLILLLAFGLLLRWARFRRIGFWVCAAALFGLGAAAIFPIGTTLLAVLENRFPPPELPARADGVIVLGGAVDPGLSQDRGQVALNGNAERITVFAELARRYPEAKLVYSGGFARWERGPREADWAIKLMPVVGVARDRVVLERESRNTEENVRMSRALAAPKQGEIWLLVTSARHLPRAVGVFRMHGWSVTPVPVDYRTRKAAGPMIQSDLTGGLGALDTAAYEWAALAMYRFRGTTSVFFPAP